LEQIIPCIRDYSSLFKILHWRIENEPWSRLSRAYGIILLYSKYFTGELKMSHGADYPVHTGAFLLLKIISWRIENEPYTKLSRAYGIIPLYSKYFTGELKINLGADYPVHTGSFLLLKIISWRML